ncbi:MAG: pilus assembly protein PilM [Pantoea sp.]|nr:pilus assembly protein PilM [Pantoea sp.]
MAFQKWQVGLDIQNGQLCALGIQRRRHGWQLRHWWQHTLPHDTLSHGALQCSPMLLTVLRRWRKKLPRNLSLRIGFPPQAVMQRSLPTPSLQLREPELGRYAIAAAERLFPLAAHELALDYHAAAQPQSRLYLTAARQSVLQQWLSTLAQAGLQPDVIEPTSGALARVGKVMQLSDRAALIHQLSDHWLWYLPGEPETASGWAPGVLATDREQLSLLPSTARELWFSANVSAELLTGMQPLQPLSLLQFLQPPLPAHGGMFTLALGLALRPEDTP